MDLKEKDSSLEKTLHICEYFSVGQMQGSSQLAQNISKVPTTILCRNIQRQKINNFRKHVIVISRPDKYASTYATKQR